MLLGFERETWSWLFRQGLFPLKLENKISNGNETKAGLEDELGI